MANVFDVARYILEKRGMMSHMKLQKLVYYSQAWAVVWDESPLFEEKIEAWANGPVVRRLYALLRQMFLVMPASIPGHLLTGTLTEDQKRTIDAVLDFYGSKEPQWLSDLTHMEEPWRRARRGLSPSARGHNEIPISDLAWYYGSL